MKNLVYILILLFFASCNTEEEATITLDKTVLGNWKLIEISASDGGSSGTFYPVSSDKTLTFLINGNFTCNGNICVCSLDTYTPTSGTYTIANMSLQSTTCSYVIPFTVENNIMILDYPSIEPMKAKYQKQ